MFAPSARAGLGTALLVLAGAGASMEDPQEADALSKQLTRFVAVFNLLDRKLADPFDPAEAVYRGAIPGMLRTLDPHSAFLDPGQFKSLKEMQRSTEKGFGSVVSLLPGRVIVLQTLAGSPSARAGIAPGDEVVALNGLPLTQMPVEQLVAVLSESRKDRTRLMVKRPNFTRLIPMTLIPAEMASPSVSRSFFLEPGLAYVKVIDFEAATAQELHGAVESMGGGNLKGLILDLRGNPGGIVEAAVRVAAFFLDADKPIVRLAGRSGPKEELTVPAGYAPYRFPMAVLIDERTTSAAELVAGSLQDHGRAVLVGERSYGKGLVQSVYELGSKTGLALTTAYYLTPNETPIQRSLGDCGEYQLAPCGDERSADVLRGGVKPDAEVSPPRLSRLETVLKASNSFLEFARRYVAGRREIDENFEPTNAMLDDFQLYLSERGIRPTVSEWSTAVVFARANLKQEVLNLTVGVAKGDEVELRRDPVVRAAADALRARMQR